MLTKKIKDNSIFEVFYNDINLPDNNKQKLSKIAKRKLDMIQYAVSLEDLKAPPKNDLTLTQKSKNIYSIQIEEDWRLEFDWLEDHENKGEL